jgi:glyoxylase-like metal-dependent hydrolase (beta-lactamase superfamily II)
MTTLDRRDLIKLGGLAAIAAAAPLSALAKAPPAGMQGAGVYRYKVGDIEVTAVNDGVWQMPLKEGFVTNAKLDDVQAAMKEAFLPPETLPIPFTVLVVNTGAKLVLIDTGTGALLAPTAGTLTANLAAAGIDPKSIDTILISHFHPDHINGIRPKDGVATFPNAEIKVPEAEMAFWMDDGNMAKAPEGMKPAFENVRRVFAPIAKNAKTFKGGEDLETGITAIAASGHTPGHSVFAIHSGNAKLLALSDTTNHPALFVRNPDWSAIFDMDADQARATRRKLLDMAASERMQVAGYHFPFPATGYIAKDGAKFQLVPMAWTPVL